MMLESKIQSFIIRKYTKLGYYVIKIIKTNKNGIPDLLLIKDGKASFIEVKSTGGKISELQRLRAKELRLFGCPVRFSSEGDVDVNEGTTKTIEDF